MNISADLSKAGRVCLSLLVQKRFLVLDSKSLSTPFASLFSEQFFQGLSEEQKNRCRPLVDRLQPFPSPLAVLTSDREVLDFLRAELRGISSDKTFEEAFAIKCFYTITDNSNAGILWHCAHREIPIDQREWGGSLHLKRLYQLLPLLKNVEVRQLLPGHPVLQEEFSYEQLQETWQLWSGCFAWCFGLVFTLSHEVKKKRACQPAISGVRNTHRTWASQKRELQRIFGEDLRSPQEEVTAFLAKNERLETFVKRRFPAYSQFIFSHIKPDMRTDDPYIDELLEELRLSAQERFLQENPVLWRAEIFDCVHPMIQLLSELSEIVRKWREKEIEEEREFEGAPLDRNSPLKIVGREIFSDTIGCLGQIFEGASNLSLVSQVLCKEIQRHLEPVFQGPKEGRVLQRTEEALRREIEYRSCILGDILDDFEEEEEKQPIREKTTRKKKPTPSEPPSKEEICSVQEKPQITFLDSLKRQLDADFKHLQSSSSIIGAMTPFAATLAQYIESTTRAPEIGDHLFLMTQGMELFIHCAQKGESEPLGVIFRAILVDFHVAIEQKCVHAITSSGRSNPHLHDLTALAQASGLVLSGSQRKFLESVNLALYWARYPACSEGYFRGREKPLLFQMLLDLRQGLAPNVLSELCTLYRQMLEFLIPPEISIEPCISWLQYMAAHPVVFSPPQVRLSPFQSMRASIEEALRTKTGPTRPLTEIIYYLSWIEQAQTLKQRYPHPALQFWHQRNALEVDKLFKHLYTADLLLHEGEEIRTHQVLLIIEALKGIRQFDRATKSFLCSFNMRTALHYHTHPSPMKEGYLNLLKECQLQAHGFTSREKVLLDWPFFDKAISLFQSHLSKTLTKLREKEEMLSAAARQCAEKI